MTLKHRRYALAAAFMGASHGVLEWFTRVLKAMNEGESDALHQMSEPFDDEEEWFDQEEFFNAANRI